MICSAHGPLSSIWIMALRGAVDGLLDGRGVALAVPPHSDQGAEIDNRFPQLVPRRLALRIGGHVAVGILGLELPDERLSSYKSPL